MHRYLLGLFIYGVTLATIYWGYFAAVYNAQHLSPQGCRMAWMWPQYLHQKDFNTSWTSLAQRYSLWLYREGHHSETYRELTGTPVLFIPGNSGSSKQVRSIASSAAIQYFGKHGPDVTDTFKGRAQLPLDVFAAEFNEDFSALHGPTLVAQREYILSAIDYIQSLYPPSTTVFLLGHSMGGVVAVSTLPNPKVAGVITLSTPHALPPARYSASIEAFYSDTYHELRDVDNTTTPVLSICGGPSDLMIPSESCVIPYSQETTSRRTVFSSALEGCWTGVEHQVSVWCDQVRWHVARALLEVPRDGSNEIKMNALTLWLSNGPRSHDVSTLGDKFRDQSWILMSHDEQVSLQNIGIEKKAFLLPVAHPKNKLVVYVSGGSIFGHGATEGSSLNLEVVLCSGDSHLPDCQALQSPKTQLIPNPPFEQMFPVPHEGVTHSDGVVTLIYDLEPSQAAKHVGILVEGTAAGRNWVIATLEVGEPITSDLSLWSLITRQTSIITIAQANLHTVIKLPMLHASSLMVYAVNTKLRGDCKGAVLAPVLEHQVSDERHFHFPVPNSIFLHSHNTGPFLGSSSTSWTRAINIYTSGTCSIQELSFGVAYTATFGRWATRYFGAVHAWGLCLVKWMVANEWLTSHGSRSAMTRSLQESVNRLLHWGLPLAFLVLIVSLFPLPKYIWLGNSGDSNVALIAPVVLTAAIGGVYISCNILSLWISVARSLMPHFMRRQRMGTLSVAHSMLYLTFICVLIKALIPYQVVYAFCCCIQSWACLTVCMEPDPQVRNKRNLDMHILLLFSWLVPNVAPSLAVWIRTIATTGSFKLFSSDHSLITILPFLYHVAVMRSSENVSSGGKRGLQEGFVRGFLVLSLLYDLFWGPRYPYILFNTAAIQTAVLLLYRWVG